MILLPLSEGKKRVKDGYSASIRAGTHRRSISGGHREPGELMDDTVKIYRGTGVEKWRCTATGIPGTAA